MKKEALQNLTTQKAEELAGDCRELGGIAEMIPQSDGKWTVVMIWPDKDSGIVDLGEPLPSVVHEDSSDEPFSSSQGSATDKLGELSANYESRGGPGTIGRDSTGGFSYGKYQIATKTGTMERYLQFLNKEYPPLAKRLQDAGGAEGALDGAESFKSAWTVLAEDPEFAESQHNFIRATHYEPFADRLEAIDLDIRQRSAALKNVAWSVAVQHGPSNSVFKNALAGRDLALMSDKDIINAVYEERSKVDVYFSKSTPKEKLAVKNRFIRERSDAVAMLA